MGDAPIDAVYLWVDGTNGHTKKRLQTALARRPDHRESAVAEGRFRNHDELRYSLRSLEQYVPWVRCIYLVTDGSRPTWLRTSHPRLKFVAHEEIFADPEDLPTFNSDAIALQLHRIPGLSRHFLVVNDDCLFGQPVALEDFRHPDGRTIVYLDALEPPTAADDDPNSEALVRTRRVVEKLFPETPVKLFAHTPQLYDRDVLEHLGQQLADEFRETSAATFRSSRDLVLRLLYPSAVVAGVAGVPASEARMLSSGSPEYSFVQLKDDPEAALGDLEYDATARPRFVCFNDDLGDQPVSAFIGGCLTRTLATMFPVPASFEAGAGDGLVPATAAGGGVDPQAAAYWNRRLSHHWSSAGDGSLEYGTQFNTWRNRARVRVFRRAVAALELDPAHARALDVGTGTGVYVREWRRLGVPRLAGVDITDVAVQRLRTEYPDVELHQVDIGSGSLPFADGSFDVVSAFAVLCHVLDDDRYGAALRNLVALLAPGGYLLFTDSPVADEYRSEAYWVGRTEATMAAALADAGLEVIATYPETVLMSPPQRLGARWRSRWNQLMSLARGNEWLGWTLGAIAYPFEVGLSASLRRGPSTDLVVCRRKD